MSADETKMGGEPDVDASHSLGSQFREIAERVAKAADPDVKEFLAGILKAAEGTLADLKSMRDRLDRAQATADEATAAASRAKQDADEKAVKAEIRAEASAAGAIDPKEVLAFVWSDEVKRGDDGTSNVAALVASLKKAKPHLFARVSTSGAHLVPRPDNQSPRNAMEMNAGEYRAAKAKLMKR